MSNKGNKYWNGSNGNIWVNDAEFSHVKSFEVKMTIEWEDVPAGLTTERALMGYSYEGSFSYRKTDDNYNKGMDLLFAEYAEGRIPEVSIVAKAYNRTSGKTQRIKISEITFDELMLLNFEEKSLGEIEVPFKASQVEILQ